MQIIGWLIIFAFTWNGIKNISEGLWMNLIVDLLCVIITFFTEICRLKAHGLNRGMKDGVAR